MVYIFLFLIFLFGGLPLAHAQGQPRKVLDLSTSYPSPFGMYQRLDTKYFRMTPVDGTPPGCTTNPDLSGYMYTDMDGETHICEPPNWMPYTPGLWGKIDSKPVYSIYPTDISDERSSFSLGIGTTEPQAKLHIVGDSEPPVGTNKYISIRLEHSPNTHIAESIWELRAYQEYTDIGLPRKQLFSIWGGDVNQNDVFFITKETNVHLIDSVHALPGGGPNPATEPKLNVQRQRSAYNDANNTINLDNLAAAFTYNIGGNSPLGVGIGFGVDIDRTNQNYQQQYGAAIALERTNTDSVGKLHFATKNSKLGTNRNLPVHMTIDEEGHVGIGTTDPKEFQLRVKDNGFLVEGDGDASASLNVSGAGTRLMWWPQKKAFRAGGVEGDFWNEGNLGEYSVAFGRNNLASGSNSVALGGYNNQATGLSSGIVAGKLNMASGEYATVLGGLSNTAEGDYSLAAGRNMTAKKYGSMIFGQSNNIIETEQPNTFIIMMDKVGIGTTSPLRTLHVKGDIYAQGEILASGKIDDYVNLQGGPRVIQSPSKKDLAELFETSEEVEPGDLLVIDGKTRFKLRKSLRPYEKGILGIVSQLPAILFEGSQIRIAPDPGGFTKGTNPPVALAGQVPCKVTNENGAIEVGDLLTSSSIPGHAMKATDREKAFGTIVGKALEPFTAGPKGEATGIITVFVTLQ